VRAVYYYSVEAKLPQGWHVPRYEKYAEGLRAHRRYRTNKIQSAALILITKCGRLFPEIHAGIDTFVAMKKAFSPATRWYIEHQN
jgi:hypothetical protein